MPSRHSTLTARLEDLQTELEALRYYRRRRIITDARAFNREKQRLLDLIGDVEQNLRSLEIQRQIQQRERAIREKRERIAREKREKAKNKREFMRTLETNFASRQPFTIQFGNEFITDVEILERIVRQAGRWTIQIGNQFYTLNDKTRVRLRDLIENDLIVTENTIESDGLIVQHITQIRSMTIAPVEEFHQYALDNAAFFKYIHNTHYDLSRYQIFNSIDAKNYEDNCLIWAMMMAELPIEKIQDMKLCIKNRSVPKSDLKLIAEKYDLTIVLRTANQEKQKGKPFTFGTGSTLINLGLLDNHYFLNEKTNYTRYCLEHYDEVKQEKESNFIYKKSGIYFKRDKTRCIDSYDLIKILLERKDTLLKEITMNDQLIATTQFYDKVDTEIQVLEYNKKKCCRKVEKPKDKKDEIYKNVIFDFETYLRDGEHIPYLVVMYDGKEKRTFYGENCGFQMLCALTCNTRLIAHNANYDYRFIIKYLQQIEELARGNRLISSNAIFNGHKIQIKDSFHLISMPLKKFPKTFGIKNTIKEVMPYALYNDDTYKQRWFNPQYVAETFLEEKDHQQFFDNIKKWKLENNEGDYDIVEYSRRYCEIDCEILFQGYNTFRNWILELIKIDIDDVLTSASLAHRYLINEGCYEDVYELSGIPQMFIQGAVVGGRTMCSENKKIKIEGKINDFDAVSLYPSAMRRMDGFLKGTPKVLENLSYDFLKQQDGYFVDVRVTSVGVKRKFPLMSYKNENGVRMFSNDMIGKIIRVDRYTLEDLIEFQGITFEVLRGYYFNEGFNNRINEVIKFLFEERLKKKKEGNPSQEVYKLIMNSGYGKSIMKPVEVETRFFDDEEKFKVFFSRHYNWVTQYTKFGRKIKVQMVKTLNEHYNIAQVGTMILSMSKRIMNEVMCLAEDNGLEVYYQDTDSNHILDKDIEVLARLFKEKYGRELIGKGFGQFHSDFEIDGADDVYSRRAIFLGKKCYIDELVGMNKDGEQVVDYHIRMKGIPNACILYTANKLGYSTPFEMYQDLYNGKAIEFDLTNDGSKANFKFEKDYSVNTLDWFKRTISF